MTALIQTKAKAHGTFASPSNRGIIHIDPNNDQKAANSPQLTRAEADEAFSRGLIEDPDGAKSVSDDDTGAPADENALGLKAAERTEEFAKEDDKGGIGSGTLDSRQSTAFQDRDRVEGGAEGYTDGVREVETTSSDEDAPPAPARGGRSAPKAK